MKVDGTSGTTLNGYL